MTPFGMRRFDVLGDDPDQPQCDGPDLSSERLATVLEQIKRNSRNRRIAMMAPLVLAGAVLGALMAAPPRYGGLALVPDAEAAVAQLPRVFGSNGVWRPAEPIAVAPVGVPGPAAVVLAATDPVAPAYVLSPPNQEELKSLPVSTSTPPTSTPGQSLGSPAAQLDWSSFGVIVRVASDADDVPDDAAVAADVAAQFPTPVPSARTEGPTPSNDITVAVSPQNDLGQSRANPSTPLTASADFDAKLPSAAATIIQKSVLVYSAHVSVTVQVVDDDSSVIDWCRTRVDWGDGSVTRAADTYGVAPCTALCEYGATPSGVGIDTTLVFTHEYNRVIDAAPRLIVATGDGCTSTLAELQLNEFTVIPL